MTIQTPKPFLLISDSLLGGGGGTYERSQDTDIPNLT